MGIIVEINYWAEMLQIIMYASQYFQVNLNEIVGWIIPKWLLERWKWYYWLTIYLALLWNGSYCCCYYHHSDLLQLFPWIKLDIFGYIRCQHKSWICESWFFLNLHLQWIRMNKQTQNSLTQDLCWHLMNSLYI